MNHPKVCTDRPGMKTSFWGPPTWIALFTILYNYPKQCDPKNKEHIRWTKDIIKFLEQTAKVLPCKYCRASFKEFMKMIPISEYTQSRRRMVYWLYLIRDQVNKKLICQENDEYDRLASSAKTTKERNALRKEICKTQPSPPFSKVYNYFGQFESTSYVKGKQ